MKLIRFRTIATLIAAAAVIHCKPLDSQSSAGPTYASTARVCAIHDFYAQQSDPAAPIQISAIARGDDGFFYTTSQQGGKSTTTGNLGTIYRFSYSPPKTTLETLFSFDNVPHGATPMGGLIKSNDGYFYGTTSVGGLFPVNNQGAMHYGNGTLFRFKLGETAPEMIHTFRYGNATGIPYANCPTPLTCYWSPQQRMNAAGGIPLSAPVLASDGNLYGVTSGGIGFGNIGVLYKVAPYKSESAITGLCIGGPMPADTAKPTDAELRDLCMFNGKFGNLPVGLIADSNNHLYGTTIQVGGGSYGTVFRIDLPSGRITTLYNFTDPKNGSVPYGVTLASDGYLYGVTKYGGPLYGLGNAGAGLIYRLLPTGGGFEIVHAFNGNTEGTYPVAGLVEAKSSDGNSYLYGSTTGGGNLRGVLFRVLLGGGEGPVAPGSTFSYRVLYAFPGTWSVAGSFPASTMIAVDDPKYGPTLYGTTWAGGSVNYGALFRLSGVDLPTVPVLANPVTYAFTAATQHFTPPQQIIIPGQSQPTTVDVYTHVRAQSGSKTPESTQTEDGFMIRAGNCRSPHIVQFIYREKIGLDGQLLGGTYTRSNGQSYPLTTDDANPTWHTDSTSARDAYYETQQGVPVITNALGVTFFDEPSFAGTDFLPGAQETWKAVFKSYVVCNCQVISEVKWTRQVRWIANTSGTPTIGAVGGTQSAPEYVNVSVVTPDDPNFDWMNQQVLRDGLAPIP